MYYTSLPNDMDLEGYESESMLAHKHTEVCERIVKMGEFRGPCWHNFGIVLGPLPLVLEP